MDYTNYEPEDFLTDEQFIGWVKHPNKASDEFWDKWLKEHPGKRHTVNQARQLLTALRFQQQELSNERRGRIEERIMHQIDRAKTIPRPAKRLPLAGKPMTAKYTAAAILVGIIVAAAIIISQTWNSRGTVYQTDYAETKTVRLPDGSGVTLNANSEISYRVNPETGDREVELKGEAYFQVEHQENTAERASGARRFIVHTPGMDIVVLGTAFNVNNRRGNTNVVLESGQVKIRFAENTGKNEELIMEPGEMVSYKKAGSSVVLRTVDTRAYISWKDNLLIFNHTPLSEIVRLLQDNYDYQVRIEDPQVADKVYEGTFPADDVTVLLKTLEKSVSLEIDGKEIVIKEKIQTKP